MRRAAGDAFVGAGEGPRPLLNEIALFGIVPIGRQQREHRRSAGGQLCRIA